MMRTFAPLLIVATLVFAALSVWGAVLAHEGQRVLTVAFLDVGQGDSIYIEAPNGRQMLIDGGRGGVVLRELANVMPYYDRTLDVVVATHPDSDHIGGLPAVFDRYDISYYVATDNSGTTATFAALQDAVSEEGSSVIAARSGTRIMLDTEVYFEILFPDRSMNNVESNASSIVGRLVYGDTSFVFSGDAPQGVEQHVTSYYGRLLKSDVLKLGHHGSKTSTVEQFLAALAPEFAVVSAGCGNQYGHPHREVLERVEAFGAHVFSTCDGGTIVFESDGEQVSHR